MNYWRVPVVAQAGWLDFHLWDKSNLSIRMFRQKHLAVHGMLLALFYM
jgi:hypothetical protein